jgi:transporter family protein
MSQWTWLVYALIGATFAGVVNVLSKKGLGKADFLVGLSIQSLLALVTVLVSATVMRRWSRLTEMPRQGAALMAAAGVAAGMSWVFGYRALQLSAVDRSSPIDKLSLPIAVLLAMIFLRERPSVLNWVGIALMLTGAVCVAHSGKNAG